MTKPEDVNGLDEPFRPLRTASGPKLIAAIVFGPVLWAVALIVVGGLVKQRSAVELGLLIAGASFVIATVVLGLLRLGRRREERRYVNGA